MLVKWWLLALPHYLVVGVFIGAAWVATDRDWMLGSGGLVGLLVLFAGVALLFTGRYPKALYDFVLGMNRWVFRGQKLGTWISTERAEDLEALRDLLEAGKVTPIIDRTYPLSDVAEAIRHMRKATRATRS